MVQVRAGDWCSSLPSQALRRKVRLKVSPWQTINGLYFLQKYLFALYFLGIINVSRDDGINVAATQQKLLTQTLPFIPENRAIANKHSIILLYTDTKEGCSKYLLLFLSICKACSLLCFCICMPLQFKLTIILFYPNII